MVRLRLHISPLFCICESLECITYQQSGIILGFDLVAIALIPGEQVDGADSSVVRRHIRI